MFSSLSSLFSGLFSFFGFSLSSLSLSLVLVGLDNAGKTTLQQKLKTGKFIQFAPTNKAKDEVFTIGSTSIRAWDLGGHAAVRHAWRRYSKSADGLIFMVDASDLERLEEAKNELHALLNDKAFTDVPVAVLLNKRDVPGSLGADQGAREAMGVAELGHAKIELFDGSILKEFGYNEAIEWIVKQAKQQT